MSDYQLGKVYVIKAPHPFAGVTGQLDVVHYSERADISDALYLKLLDGDCIGMTVPVLAHLCELQAESESPL